MRLSQLLGRREKNIPREAQAISHQLLLRGGYIRPLAAGIYNILPLGKRVLSKIEALVREEMNDIGGQEVLMPVVMPRDIWQESGRYASIDQSMVRFKDRADKDLVLGMTHEEAVLAMVRSEVSSYRQLPMMLYQIQTKFRDEPRSRGGLIRTREFTMKDAYSFHRDDQDLKDYYQQCYDAYLRVFKRVGLSQVKVVKSDSGMMGGKIAHEFMLEAAIGEDSLVLCSHCGYAANAEIAASRARCTAGANEQALLEVETPHCKTIAELCAFLNLQPQQTAKAVLYSCAGDHGQQKLVFALIRGDQTINDIKLAKVLQTQEFKMASDAMIKAVGAEPGYASPVNLSVGEQQLQILVDPSVAIECDLATGANRQGHHFLHFNALRDIKCDYQIVDITHVQAGDACCECGEALRLTRGIEVGNIFQLGNRYTLSMGMSFLDEEGKPQVPVMGCYGIGIGRLMACIIEERHDADGPLWPWNIAPYHIHLCALESNKNDIAQLAERIYEQLKAAGFEVLWDDTNNPPGAQFGDADLIGAPIRLTLSPRNVKNGEIEVTLRDKSEKLRLPVGELLGYLQDKRRQFLGS